MVGLFDGLTIGANAPVNNFGFLNFISVLFTGAQAGDLSGVAVRVHKRSTLPTDQVVMIICPTFIASGGSRGLNASDQPMLGQDVQGIIDGLPGDRPDFRSNRFTNPVGNRMRMFPHSAMYRQTLSRHLQSGVPKSFRRCFME